MSKIRKNCFTLIVIFGVMAVFSGLNLLGQQLKNRAYASNGRKIVTIHDQNQKRTIMTSKSRVRDVLEAAKIQLNKLDLVEPALDTEISDGFNINIFRARPLTIVDGERRINLLTPYQLANDIAKEAGLTLYPEDEVNFSQGVMNVAPELGTVMTIKRATEFKLNFFGKQNLVRTQAKTVGQFLKERQIKLGPNDKVNLPDTTPITKDIVLEIWQEGQQERTVEEEVNFKVRQIHDHEKPANYREIRQAGVKGKQVVTYKIEVRNGREISRHKLKSVTIKEPTEQIEVVGAKSNYSGSLAQWLLALRNCETGGNYARNSGNGYYGAYQFLPSTWNAVARRSGRPDLVGVRPDRASPADQDAMVIANARSSAGLSTQHPGCYRKLGLSNKPPAN